MHPKSDPRRRHSDEFKAKVLAACDEPGVSISRVALAHGLNTNLVRKWRIGRGFKLSGTAVPPATSAKAATASAGAQPDFVAIEMPAPAPAAQTKTTVRAAAQPVDTAPIAEPLIQIELRRGPLHLSVRWPVSAGDDCTAWLRELSSGLLK
jgi:transposase